VGNACGMKIFWGEQVLLTKIDLHIILDVSGLGQDYIRHFKFNFYAYYVGIIKKLIYGEIGLIQGVLLRQTK
jgi:hypothetical protein